ncbi:helix-turn-helix transcriptional regulator [Paenibacillus soyae]|uniref:Helix-turn-helix domain-containing protein n=1 Tax=Paenibacillus soyae TaxID=2969249 RepID=A0A9X2MP79_9BACL|nr:AraC family transcriptional regulator [Paenibacillus soyae]MCR2803895.1 helix-turn-helix domain-containing protein [Paenibacillus soyae]
MASRIEHVEPGNRSFFLAFRDEWSGAEQHFQKFHAHQGLELLFIHEGEGVVEVDGDSYELETGTLFCFQPYQLHKLDIPGRMGGRYVRTNLTFDPRFLEPYLAPFPKLEAFLRYLHKGTLSSPKFSFEESRLSALIEGHARSVAEPGEEREEARVLFLITLLRHLQLSVIPRSDQTPEGWSNKNAAHIEAIMDWVELHYKRPFSLELLAEELHLSPTYVSHLFKQYTGVSLTDYVTGRRIREACALLGNSDKPVGQIASEIGGFGAPYFCKLFKKHKGMTPLDYRSALHHSAKA